MRSRPLIVYKTQNGCQKGIHHFRSIDKARTWLRAEGCKFKNHLLNDLDSESALQLVSEEYEYEIQTDPLSWSSIRRKNEPVEE